MIYSPSTNMVHNKIRHLNRHNKTPEDQMRPDFLKPDIKVCFEMFLTWFHFFLYLYFLEEYNAYQCSLHYIMVG